ncbi:MAG: GH1 family beta-glucosidase [Thiotrichales bacterium]
MSTVFPADFVWGAATSAYQIEGAPLADGAGTSNWHRFSHTPGRIAHGDTGDIACDHYHRWREDIALLADLGLRAYRFSIAWSRVQPNGRGAINPAGLGFYERLVDALLEHGIQPYATLYHWDHPAALDDLGGWMNPDMAKRFGDYSAGVFRALDDRVGHWMTLNEPWVVMECGFRNGSHPPGLRSPAALPWVARHLLRAHDNALRIYREEGRHQIGLVVNLEPKYPASERDEDLAACARAEAYMNRLFLDPVLRGHYPEALRPYFAAWAPEFDFDADAALQRPLDFLGVNYYSRSIVRHAPGAAPVDAAGVPQDAPHTAMGWEVYPQGLSDVLQWVRDRYGELPLYVTENGAAFADPAPSGGRIDDSQRSDYLRRHLVAAHAAIAVGVDLKGYFAWSLLDNFEWNFGYEKRFGLIGIDPQTLARIPKRSAEFYRAVVNEGGFES